MKGDKKGDYGEVGWAPPFIQSGTTVLAKQAAGELASGGETGRRSRHPNEDSCIKAGTRNRGGKRAAESKTGRR